jgi:hypothetical protein
MFWHQTGDEEAFNKIVISVRAVPIIGRGSMSYTWHGPD